jgi:hypothetical protein
MKPEHWLAVATIASTIIVAIATLLAPALGIYVQHRMSKATQTPDIRNRSWVFRFSFLMGQHFGGIISVICICTLLTLAFILYTHATVTRWTVLLISILVGLLVLQLVFYILVAIYRVALRWALENDLLDRIPFVD